jgi:hypothetical protein
MPGWRDVLSRFRAVGPPGSAAPAAVPADRRSRLVDELAPVFAALHDARVEAEQLRHAAQDAADVRRADGVRQAVRLVSEASATRDAVRAAAFAAGRAATDAQAEGRIAAGRREADRVGRVASMRRQALVDRACDIARSVLDAPVSDHAGVR